MFCISSLKNCDNFSDNERITQRGGIHPPRMTLFRASAAPADSAHAVLARRSQVFPRYKDLLTTSVDVSNSLDLIYLC